MIMRTIKFRGKLIGETLPLGLNKGDWWTGFYYEDLHCGEWKSFIKCGELDLEVDKDTVGQFTGLLDKNGKEIYEGDIIRSYDSNGETITHYIEWKERDAVYRATNIKYPLLGGWAYQDWIDEFEKEIIGNVFVTPNNLKTETL